MNIIPAEQVAVQTTDYSTKLVFGLANSPEPLCVVVLPHPIAKQLAMILRAQLLNVERAAGGEIRILPAAFKQMGVSPEDWPSQDGPGQG